MKSFAICIVGYNRISGIKRLLKSLEEADYNNRTDITLIFSIDNSGSAEVEEFANNYNWRFGEKRIRTFEKRQGLKNHIIQCGDFTSEYDILVVLEDDLYVSNSFYHYAYNASEYYWDDENIAGISLYNFQKHWIKWLYRFEPQTSAYDTYFLRIAQSWGQVWTYKKWSKFKKWYNEHLDFTFSDKIPIKLNNWPKSSWLKYHTRYCIETNKFFVYPYSAYSTDYTDPGEHSRASTTEYQVEMQWDKKAFSFAPFNSSSVRYNEYMERIGVDRYLGIKEDELTVDLYNTTNRNLYKRYVLTTEKLNFKILKSYGLNLRPIELNVIKDILGSDIYLYDITIPQKNTNQNNSFYKRTLYSIRSKQSLALLQYSILTLLQNIPRVKNIPSRIIRKIKK